MLDTSTYSLTAPYGIRTALADVRKLIDALSRDYPDAVDDSVDSVSQSVSWCVLDVVARDAPAALGPLLATGFDARTRSALEASLWDFDPVLDKAEQFPPTRDVTIYYHPSSWGGALRTNVRSDHVRSHPAQTVVSFHFGDSPPPPPSRSGVLAAGLEALGLTDHLLALRNADPARPPGTWVSAVPQIERGGERPLNELRRGASRDGSYIIHTNRPPDEVARALARLPDHVPGLNPHFLYARFDPSTLESDLGVAARVAPRAIVRVEGEGVFPIETVEGVAERALRFELSILRLRFDALDTTAGLQVEFGPDDDALPDFDEPLRAWDHDGRARLTLVTYSRSSGSGLDVVRNRLARAAERYLEGWDGLGRLLTYWLDESGPHHPATQHGAP